MCVITEWEYAPRWSIRVKEDQHMASVQESLEACAAACEADNFCTGATYMHFDPPKSMKNCYFKAWAPPPAPAALPCYAGMRRSVAFHSLGRPLSAMEATTWPKIQCVPHSCVKARPHFSQVAPALSCCSVQMILLVYHCLANPKRISEASNPVAALLYLPSPSTLHPPAAHQHTALHSNASSSLNVPSCCTRL
jgi:hypothetical protein